MSPGERPVEPRTAYDTFRENLESLLIAVILAVIIRHFAVEAFEIPTGSMAPTLYGMHIWAECPNCDSEYNVAIRTDPETGDVETRITPVSEIRDGQRVVVNTVRFPARCPICAYEYLAQVPEDHIRNGNKIFVDKFLYVYGKPTRFDVIVFEFDQWKNYIKRLVGLPGETIQIFDGDLYVNGDIVRKADFPRVQEELWYEVSDSDVVEKGLNKIPAWSEIVSEYNEAWTPLRERTRWSLNHPGGEREPAVLEYRRPLDNFLAYNLTFGQQNSRLLVGDRRLDFTATPLEGRGWIGARVRDGRFDVSLRIPVGESSAERPTVIEAIEAVGTSSGTAQTLRETVEFALEPGRATEIRFENVDDQAILRVDGERIASLDFVSCPDPSHPPERNGAYAVELAGWGVKAELREIRLYRDLYYVARSEASLQGGRDWSGDGIRLGPGEYLALGDNSASSSDSRVWGHVPERNLMGKALMVFWPAWPLNFQVKFIR